MQYDLTPAQRALQGKARELARGPIAQRAAEIDRTEQYPWDHVDLLKEAGFFGMTAASSIGWNCFSNRSKRSRPNAIPRSPSPTRQTSGRRRC